MEGESGGRGWRKEAERQESVEERVEGECCRGSRECTEIGVS